MNNEVEKYEKEIVKLIEVINDCNFKEFIVIENKIKRYFEEIERILFEIEDTETSYVEQHRSFIKNLKLKFKVKIEKYEKKENKNEIQESLLRTRNQIIENVNRSQTSMNSIMKSRDVLNKTFNTKNDLNESLKLSNIELKRIQENEYWNYFYTCAAFTFFFLVFIYIFNKRIPILSILIRFFHLFISILKYFISFIIKI